jgi:hypothetical protein
MATQTSRPLGILSLERGGRPEDWPKVSGHVMNPEAYAFTVIFETVEGAWTDVIIPGDPSLEPAFVAAARRLVDRGAAALLGNCGFFIRHQAAVAVAVKVPVVTSTLLMVPSLLRQLPAGGKLAVLTADSRHLPDDLLGLHSRADLARVVVSGIEGGKYLADAMRRPLPAPDIVALENDAMGCVERVRAAYPEVAAFLCECTAFPAVAPIIRKKTRLPVYDIVNVAHITMASVN